MNYLQYPEPIEASDCSMPSAGKKTSTYDPTFEQNLIDYGVYPDHRQPAENIKTLQQRLAEPRPSLTPSQFPEAAFEEFRENFEEASNEAEVLANAFPIIRGASDIPCGMNRPFKNLTPLTDGSLVDAKPDFYDGARLQQLDSRVRKELNTYIIPSKHRKAPALPNHFTEGKGPEGTEAVAKRQLFYDGALGARAMHHLQSYAQPEVYDNNAYTMSASFQAGTLSLYSHHLTAPTEIGGLPACHMNQIRSFAMTDSPETFRQGATAYRNARDWAREQRDEIIEVANQTVARMP